MFMGMKGEVPTNHNFHIAPPPWSDLDGSDSLFVAREHGEDDVSNDNSTGKEDDDDINGVKLAANTATDVKPDATPNTDCETLVKCRS